MVLEISFVLSVPSVTSLKRAGFCWIERFIPILKLLPIHFFLDKLADRCRELILKPSSPRMTCEVLNRVLFHEYGFRGAGKFRKSG